MLDAFKPNGSSPPDFDRSGHGTLFLLRPLTQAAHCMVAVRRGPNAIVITCACGATLPVHHRAKLSIAKVMQRHLRNQERRRHD